VWQEGDNPPLPPSDARARLVSALLWLAAAPLVAWAIVRAFGLESGYPLVPLIAYTPFVAIAAVLVLVVAAALRRSLPAAVAGSVALLLAILVLPRAFPADQSALASDGPELRVMSANLLRGSADLDRVVQLVREEEVDVLSIQELTPAADRGLRRAGLTELLGERAVFAEPEVSGSGLYARWRLDEVALIAGSGDAFGMPRASVGPPGADRVEVIDVHPVPPTSSGAVSTWSDGLRSLPPADLDGVVRVLVGDFNATLDHDELRRLLDTGYVDAADAVGKGLTPTWPEGRLIPPSVTIDHVLVDERVRVSDVNIHELPGSDHRAVTAELALPPRTR
jgi:endonuclease/exonuclease/phosphatase (EEP) superfamily protein YafD